MRPLAIDLYAGLGGWTEGLLAEGFDVIGFDIERHEYWLPDGEAQSDKIVGCGGKHEGQWSGFAGENSWANREHKANGAKRLVRYPAQLVIQDVLTLYGSQFKNVDLIVASPPCQAYSYRAMPWSRAKALPPPDNSLFEACFRIQREACEAAGRHIPLVVENVRGAQKWVGRSRWNYGSFHLWGDVPALMPMAKAVKHDSQVFRNGLPVILPQVVRVGPGQAIKGENGGWFNDNKRAGKDSESGYLSRSGSKSNARKAASAMIAKIPLPLARHIAAYWHPRQVAA